MSSSPSGSPEPNETNEIEDSNAFPTTFEALNLISDLLSALSSLNYTNPTAIQAQSIPVALNDRDVIGVAKTGSGKTAAFALPILQKWWESLDAKGAANSSKGTYACVLVPTRELAYQIQKQFEALGANMGVRCCTIVGGLDIMAQKVALAKRPHVIIATPGRLQDHLESTKGFHLRTLKYLVLDEADRLLDMDFGPVIEKILKVLPKERRTMMFSATMSASVARLQRASLINPVKVDVGGEGLETVETLKQYYIWGPLVKKEVNLIVLIRSLIGKSIIIFTNTVNDTVRLTLMLRRMNIAAIPLHSKLSQSTRLGSLNKFRAGGRDILVATDVAARGLDIPQVDLVVNYGVPMGSKDYIHRVGRTARAGRDGKAITFVCQYDVEFLLRIEGVVGTKLEEWVIDPSQADNLREKVEEVGREVAREMKDQDWSKGGGKGGKKSKRGARDDMDRDDDDEQLPTGITVHKSKKRRA